MGENRNGKSLLGLAASTIWIVWKARCNWFFRNERLTPRLVAAEASAIHNSSSSTQLILLNSGSPSNSTPSFHWLRPPENVIKINTDAAINCDDSGVGVISRNHFGENLLAVAYYGPPAISLEAKLLAIRLGLRLASDKVWKHIIIESDSQVAIHFLNDHTITTLRSILPIILDCRELKSKFDSFIFSFIFREGNRCAHTLAQFARRRRCNLFTEDKLGPLCIASFIPYDGLY